MRHALEITTLQINKLKRLWTTQSWVYILRECGTYMPSLWYLSLEPLGRFNRIFRKKKPWYYRNLIQHNNVLKTNILANIMRKVVAVWALDTWQSHLKLFSRVWGHRHKISIIIIIIKAFNVVKIQYDSETQDKLKK